MSEFWIYLLSYALRQRIKAFPGVLKLRLLLLNRAARKQLVTDGTRICLEGFPRSGNGYSYICVRDVLRISGERVGHHTHSIANVKRAVKRGIPAFVLSREPASCGISLVAWGACRTFEDALRAYEQFYTALLPLLAFVTIIPFECLVEEPHLFICRVAEQLGMEAPVWNEAIARSVEEIAERANRTLHGGNPLRASLPHIEKELSKIEILKQPLAPEAALLLERCRMLRTRILASAPDVVGNGVTTWVSHDNLLPGAQARMAM